MFDNAYAYSNSNNFTNLKIESKISIEIPSDQIQIMDHTLQFINKLKAFIKSTFESELEEFFLNISKKSSTYAYQIVDQQKIHIKTDDNLILPEGISPIPDRQEHAISSSEFDFNSIVIDETVYQISDENIRSLNSEKMLRSIDILSSINSAESDRLYSNKSTDNISKKHRELIENTRNISKSSIFDITNIEISKKLYSKVCFNCKKTFQQEWNNLCCENFICHICVKKYYSILIAILGKISNNFNECFSCCNNLNFCSFCLVIDFKENLISCDNSMCMTLFHPNCYKIVIILGTKDMTQISLNSKEKFYYNLSTEFLKTYSTRDCPDDVFSEQIKKINYHVLAGSKSKTNKVPILSLYKVNSTIFYKLFIRVFTECFLRELPNLFTPTDLNFTNKFCQKHTCFNCFEKIDPLSSKDCFCETVEVCCNSMHIACYKGKNPSVKCSFGKMNLTSCHFPMLHLNFFNDYYNLIKAALKHLIIEVDKNILQRLQINIKNKNGIIDSTNSNVLTNRVVNLTNSEYLYLKNEILSKVIINSTVSNVKFNKISNKLSYNDVVKCNCMDTLVRKFEENKISSKYKKGLPGYVDMKLFAKYLLDKDFLKFLKVNEKLLCGVQCKNRSTFTECNNMNCHLTNKHCRNRYTKINNLLNLKIVKTANTPPYGLISTRNFTSGEFILEVVGKIIENEEYNDEVINRTNEFPYLYWLTFSYNCFPENKILNCNEQSNLSRFINHSCKPNAAIQLWNSETKVKNVKKISSVQGTFDKKFLIFSSRDILKGEEITIDYESISHDKYQGCLAKFECKCEENCDKVIGENIEEEIKQLAQLNKNSLMNCFKDDDFKNSREAFKWIFTEYENKVRKYGNVFLIKNFRKKKQHFIRYTLNLETPKEIINNLPKFIGHPNCYLCKENIVKQVEFCRVCWKSFHIRCTKNRNFRQELCCNNCKIIKHNSNSHRNSISKFSNINLIPVSDNLNNKYTKSVRRLKQIEVNYPNLKYECVIYEGFYVKNKFRKNYEISINTTNKKCEFYSIFYEYKNNHLGKQELVKRFIFMKSIMPIAFYEREFCINSEIMFHKIINKISTEYNKIVKIN